MRWYDRAMALASRLLSTVDRAAIAMAQLGTKKGWSKETSLDHEARLAALAVVEEEYREAPDFFSSPPSIAPALSRVRELPVRGVVLDASWPSATTPYLEAVRDDYLARRANRTAHARLLLHREPRPAILCLHGYLAGRYSIEERLWPLRGLYRAGIDVALPVLPFHALRGEPGKMEAPPFPAANPRWTIEGFRQATYDLRALLAWLRARGAPWVGVMGMSLGGYTSALLATVERDLAFAVPVIPLASVADFARDRGRLGGADTMPAQHAALERAYTIVSPLVRPAVIPSSRLLIVGAESDAITPIAHAERLAAHFSCNLERVGGSHLIQVGMKQGFRAVKAMLTREGLV